MVSIMATIRKAYYNSLHKPKKPIPTDLKKLHVKTTEKSLP